MYCKCSHIHLKCQESDMDSNNYEYRYYGSQSAAVDVVILLNKPEVQSAKCVLPSVRRQSLNSFHLRGCVA